jgi:1-carboxybiuret hydrolase subunit AtzG-like protein
MTRKPATRKTRTARRGTTSRPLRAKKPDALDALVAASAAALALPLDPAWRGGIRFNLRLIFTHAALVDEFPLGDETEPAPVFHA